MIRAVVLGLAMLAPGWAAAQSVAERLNDYPTEARADYVFGCMASNGQSRQVLRQCACSIDEIASILPYEQYVEAETVLSMRLTGGRPKNRLASAIGSSNNAKVSAA